MSLLYPPPVGRYGSVDHLSAFTDTVFAHLQRADQRRWGHAYLQGLLTVPGKKTVRRLAAASTASPTAFQSLQQFVNSSPWEWEPVRGELARWSDARLSPRAWTVSTTVAAKRGDHSCGVHRRFVPHLGQHVNGQMSVGLFMSDGTAAVPVDWRLHLPERWTHPHLRRRARIPGDARSLPPWADALEMADRLRRCHGLTPAPLVADMSGTRPTADLACALLRQRNEFVIAVPPALPVMAVDASATALAQLPSSDGRRTLMLSPSASAVLHARGALRHGQRAGRGLTCLARLPVPTGGAWRQGVLRLFTDPRQPERIWLTNMVRHRLSDLRLLTEHLVPTAECVRELEEDFGLLDFEGRSYPGWHHFMTLMSAAHAYRRLAGTPLRPSRALRGVPA
ncbi:IS701 family transposase [Streptomyces spinosus]|uniref:IS701 family transposase n=1 Tax=Streptomyces spinosus TaxID=2872623 RepID=UPI001CED5144|nr:transposase [Streptomyces spinosus]